MITLQYFDQDEFTREGPHGPINWYSRMSFELLIKLDLLRLNWGKPIRISPNRDAIGRFGRGSSYHFWETHGEVKAIDIMPEGIDTMEGAERFIDLCITCGLTGIGFYPHWKPSMGFHVDVRDTHEMGKPALWGGVRRNKQQVYVTIDEALDEVTA